VRAHKRNPPAFEILI